VFVVVINGAPGAGKTLCLMVLSDALVKDDIAHATIDVDEVAWAYPYPSDAARLTLLGASWEVHRRAGHELLLVGEVVESNDALGELLTAVGARDHLHVRLEAPPTTLRERIMDREPPGWSGLEYLLKEMERWAVVLKDLDGVHLGLDTVALSPEKCAARIRAARPDKLGG
jgi:ABC-type phosphonate transport system ATPase subunit